jgi:hypothetical protein
LSIINFLVKYLSTLAGIHNLHLYWLLYQSRTNSRSLPYLHALSLKVVFINLSIYYGNIPKSFKLM